jgi:lipopolysaccharide biosynthesis glycosyltransferase
MSGQKNIPVYFVTNWDMVGYTATTMASLLSNTKRNCDFYVMDCGLSTFDRQQLSTLKDRFSNLKSLSFATVDMNRFEGLNVWYYGMLDAWAMLLFPEAFPDVHGKVIHIESDTLVVGDIEKLYNENLDGYTIGAAPEIAFGALTDLFPSKDHYYFNLGMIVIDCDKWRQDDTTAKCLELGRKYGKRFNCLHQDALNMLYYNNNYKKLLNRYNLGERKNYVKIIHPDLSDEYFEKEWKDPVIIHFSPNKPWRTQHSFYDEKRIVKYFNEWWYYAYQTPYFWGMENAFMAKKIEDEITGLKIGVSNYGNSLLDTLPDGHPFKGIHGEGVIIDLNKNIFNASAPARTSAPLPAPATKVARYRLLGLPLMKVKTDSRGSKHYKLFGILSVFKIKRDKKGGKTYKLFSCLPLWNVKEK